MHRRRSVWWLPLALCLAACSGIVAPDQTTSSASAPVSLRPGETVGQTFVARQMGFNGVEVFLAPGSGATGELRLSLRPEADSPMELAAATLPLSTVTAPNYYRFSFAPQRDSRQRYYAIQLELAGAGEVEVGQGAADSYLDGALYQNGQPVEAQMMFHLVYDTPHGLLGLGLMLIEWMGLSAIGLVLFVAPGWAALTRWWPKDTPLTGPGKFGLAAGLSVALYPVLMLWTHLIGLQLGALYAWLPGLLGTVAVIWQARHIRPGWLNDTLTRWRRSKTIWADVTLVFAVTLTFAVRYWLIRSQEAPMWGDSVHHTMIVQLMLDNGGLFNSWLPYAELSTFTYHFGFHAAVAAFAWLTGLDALRAVMWAGQILNGLAVLALWPLVARVNGNRWAAVATVIVAGLLSPMPNYYVNWGRYTQLAGQVILPVAMALVWWLLERRGSVSLPMWGLAALVWCGLALTHYRVLIFGIVFLGVLVIVKMIRAPRPALGLRPLGLGLAAFALFLPWFVRAFSGRLVELFGSVVTKPPAALTEFERQSNSLGDVTFYLPAALWGLVVLIVIIGLTRRDWAGNLIALWAALLLVAANPQWLGLPGAGLVGSPTVMMGAYMSVSVLLGGAGGAVLGWLTKYEWMIERHARLAQAATCGIVVLIAVLGARQRFGDYRPDLHAFVTRPDVRAAEWLRTNSPPGARFLVNDFFAYDGGLLVGSDAGWWLPLLAGHLTTLPPMTYGSEQGIQRPDFLQFVNTRAAVVEHFGARSPEALQILRANGITHVFLGQRQGRVGLPAASWLSPADFLNSSDYRLIYHQDRVYIFEIVPITSTAQQGAGVR